jgi:hypothetical protein
VKQLFVILIFSFFLISCNDADLSSPHKDERVSKTTDPIIFYDSTGIACGKILLTPFNTMSIMSSGRSFLYGFDQATITSASKNVVINSVMGSIELNSASISINNKTGKTYTEEFEDKQGNIRTRVYENGLLVSYKINGVEQ